MMPMLERALKTCAGANHLVLILCAVVVGAACTSAARAQATLEQQTIVPTDICAGIANADPSSCAQDAMSNNNWPAFLKWGQLAVAKGDYIVADWLGEVYETGDGSIMKDLVRAYMWYDIAAQLHAQKIRQMSPSSDSAYREDNQQEINYRDGIGAELSKAQIADALQLEKTWLAAHSK